MSVTAILTSDNHLGAYYARLRPPQLEERRRRLQEAFRAVVDAALELRVDLFLHAGDLFDSPTPRNADRLFVAGELQRLREAGIPVFGVSGNHDRPRSSGYDGGVGAQEELAALRGLRLFRETRRWESESLVIGGHHVTVWGLSADFGLPFGTCPLAGVDAPSMSRPGLHIVLLHCGVEGWVYPDAREPCLSLTNLAALGADVVCVGHLHGCQEKRLPGGALLLNPGSTERLSFGEESQECGYHVLTLGPEGARAGHVRLPAQPMRTVSVDVTDLGDPEVEATLMEGLASRLGRYCAEDLMLRVRLTGALPSYRMAELSLADLQDWGQERCFHFQVEAESLEVRDAAEAEAAATVGLSYDARSELGRVIDASVGEAEGEERALRAEAGARLLEAYDSLAGARS
ncbi:MAG TPA: exonuclease SbcCD subunit D [Armatimonadota bacterium]|jgi:DNA repair exonuclease SbcCD nuclease subunit